MAGRGHKGTSGVLFIGSGAGDQDVLKWRKFIQLYFVLVLFGFMYLF